MSYIYNKRAKGVPNFWESKREGLVLGFVIGCVRIEPDEWNAYLMARAQCMLLPLFERGKV